MRPRKVIQSYHEGFSGGIGDFFKGSIYALQQCEKRGIAFDLDFQHHPVGKFLKTTCQDVYLASEIIDLQAYAHDHSDRFEEEAEGPIKWVTGLKLAFEEALQQQRKRVFISSFFSDNLHFRMEHYNQYVLPERNKNFFQSKMSFDGQIERAVAELGIDNYHILHFRLGDRQILEKKTDMTALPDWITGSHNLLPFNHDFERYLQKVKQHFITNQCENLIVMSDCNELKQYILDYNENKHIHVFHTKSMHSSYQPGLLQRTNVVMDVGDIEMFYLGLDMRLLAGSQSNTSYSVYAWGSGFIFWLSKIFGVPVALKKMTDIENELPTTTSLRTLWT